MITRRSRTKTVVGVLLTAIMLFPVYWMINVSLTPSRLMRTSSPNLFPTTATFDGYSRVLHEQLPYLLTSLLVGLGTVALTLVIAAPAAFALAKLRPRGTRTLNFVLLVAQMIPGIIMALGFYSIFVAFDLTGQAWGLVLADSTIAVPFAVLVLTAFMSGIPDDLISAARIDGAGLPKIFALVILPLSRNGLITASLFTFLWSWSDFIFASTLDGSGEHRPITLGIYNYIGNNTQDWNAIMATAVVASVPAAVLLVLAQRYVAAGVTAGAVKD